MAFENDGTAGRYWSVPDIPAQSGASAWTWSLWYQYASAATELVVIYMAAGVNMRFWHTGFATKMRWAIGGSSRTHTTSEPGLNTWHHVFSSYNGSTFQTWLNGSSIGSTSISSTLDNVDGWRIGETTSGGNALDGRVAEWGQWSRALSTAERLGLQSGCAPSFYPESLVSYVDAIRAPRDQSPNKYTITETGTPIVGLHDIPGLRYPSEPAVIVVPAVAGGGTALPMAMNHYRCQRVA